MSNPMRLSRFCLKPSLLFAISAVMFVSMQIAEAVEYLVSDTGMVISISGSLNVSYNKPGQRGNTMVRVQSGQTFDPATRTVRAAVSEDYSNNFPWHITTVRANALFFVVSSGAAVVVKPATPNSPVFPGGPAPGGPGPAAE